MPEYQTICPKCGQKLTVQQEWTGKEVLCPYCHESFIIPDNISHSDSCSDEESAYRSVFAIPEMKWHRNYFWGWLYIVGSWGQVALILILGILMIILRFLPVFECREKYIKQIDRSAEEIVRKQEGFLNQYDNFLSMLNSYQHDKKSFHLFMVSQTSLEPDSSFSDDPTSLNEVCESLELVKSYKDKLQNVSEGMRKQLNGAWNSMEKELIGNNGQTLSRIKQNVKKRNSYRVSFSSGADFYTKVITKEDVRHLYQELLTLSIYVNDGTIKLRNRLLFLKKLEELKGRLIFIETALFRNGFTVGSQGKKDDKETSENIRRVDQQYSFLKKYFSEFNRNLELLSCLYTSSERPLWHIVDPLVKLEQALTTQKNLIEDYHEEFGKEFKAALLYSSFILILMLGLAFWILVIADVLRAHFDGAYYTKQSVFNLQKINKGKHFLLLAALLLMTGCGTEKKAEKALQENINQLADTALRMEYVNQINEAGDVLKYSPADNIVYLIIENGFLRPKQITRNTLVSISRQYNIRKLTFKIASVVTGKIRVNKKKGMTVPLTLNYTIEEEVADCNGVEICGIYTTTNQNGNAWFGKMESLLPSREIDYSFIIYQNRSSETQAMRGVFELEFRSGTWELSKDVSAKLEYNIKKICNEKMLEGEILSHFQSKNLVKYSGKWMPDSDIPIFKKIKGGYRFEKGEWVCHTLDEYQKNPDAATRNIVLERIKYLDSDTAKKVWSHFKPLLIDEIILLTRKQKAESLQSLQQDLNQKVKLPGLNDKDVESMKKIVMVILKNPKCGKAIVDYCSEMTKENRAKIESRFAEVKSEDDKKSLIDVLKDLIRRSCSRLLQLEPPQYDKMKSIIKEYDEWAFLKDKQIPELPYMRFLCYKNEIDKQMTWEDIGVLLAHYHEYPVNCHPEQMIPRIESAIEATIYDAEKKSEQDIFLFENFLVLKHNIQDLPSVPGFDKERMIALCTSNLKSLQKVYENRIAVAKSLFKDLRELLMDPKNLDDLEKRFAKLYTNAEKDAKELKTLYSFVSRDTISLNRFYHYPRAKEFAKICSKCKGQGKIGVPCDLCHRTGICQRCKGTGHYLGRKTDEFDPFDGDESKQTDKKISQFEKVECPVECQICGAKKTTCFACSGHGFFPDYEKIEETIDSFADLFHKNLLSSQAMYEKYLAKIRKEFEPKEEENPFAR